MNTTVLIPMKALKDAKSRLAKYIDPESREKLALLMLEHVVKTVKATDSEVEIFVVSFDKNVIEMSNSLRVKNISERISGHNRALTFAAKKINQNNPVITLSADMPLLTIDNLKQMFLLSKKNDIVLAQSKEKTGTNAVIMKKPLIIPYQFGGNSLVKFIDSARKQSLTSVTYFNESIAFDVDTIKDFEELQIAEPKLLQDLKIERVI